MLDHVFHYEILERIGEGGMGVVYRARDTRLERDVALKFLSLDFTGSESLKQRFIQEAQAASALDHQNICTIYSIEETDDGRLFIAMGYYQGETVKAKLRRGPLPWEEIVRLSLQIAAGLQAAHLKGIIHLDIKPANLMVTPEGQVKILDFGLSRFTSEIDRTRPQGPLMGTVAYMAPELVQGEETGPESDLWGLGVVMYEMATGVRPFLGKNDMAVLYGIVHKECDPPCEQVPDLPDELGRVIRRALVKDRRHRYQNSSEVLADLEQLRQQSSEGFPRPEPARRKILRRAVVTVLVLFALWAWIPRPEPQPEDGVTDVVLVSFENRSPEPDRAWMGTALAEMIRFRLPDSETFHWISGEEIDLPAGSSPSAEPVEIEHLFDPAAGFELSMRRWLLDEGIEWAVGGHCQEVEDEGGARFVIELALQDTGSGTIEKLSENGLVAELPELAARIAGSLESFFWGVAAPPEPDDGSTEAPSDPEAGQLLGGAREKLRVLEARAALDFLEKAMAIERDSPILHLTLSEAWKELHRDREARMAAEEAVKRVRRLGFRDQVYYLAWRLELRGKLDEAASVYRIWWAINDPAVRTSDPLTLDRGVHLAWVLAETRQSAAALAVAERLDPLLPDDPRLAVIEVAVYRDESHEDERAAASRAVELARRRGLPLLEARGLYLEGQAWQRLGEYGQAIAKLEAAREIYSRHGYKGGEAGVLNILGNVYYDMRNTSGAKTSYESAAQLYGEIGDNVLRARVQQNLAPVLNDRGELGAAIELLLMAMPYFNADNRDARVAALLNLGDYRISRGQFEEAADSFAQAREVLDTWRNPRLTAIALTHLGHLQAQQGRPLEARATLTRAIEAQERTQDQLWTAYARSLLAQVLYHQGLLSEALRTQEEALEVYGEAAGFVRAEIGRIRMVMGNLAEAGKDFARALETQSAQVNPGPAAQTRLYQAQLLFAENRIEESVGKARGVLGDLAENQDFLLQRAQTHVVLGRSLLALGEPEQAQREFDCARDLLANVESPLYELPLEILAARLKASRGDTTGARGHLQEPLANAMNRELVLLDFEIRLALAEFALETGSGESGRAKLEDLAQEARQKGYGLFVLLAERAADAHLIANTR